MEEVTPAIEVTPTPAPEVPADELLAGVPDGHVIETPADEPNEKVVYEYDEAGNVVGWHKEQA